MVDILKTFNAVKGGGLSADFGAALKIAEAVSVSSIYTVEGKTENWYKAKPYGFTFLPKGLTNEEAKYETFWLPIAPYNINTTTHFATNIITTLYGIVEEHSEVRYFDIDISGTTGYSPRYFDKVNKSESWKNVAGRSDNATDPLIAVDLPGGFGASAISQLNQVADRVSTALLGEAPTETGVKLEQSGYVAFHNFYRYLLTTKKAGSAQPLQFLNYKDNIKYDCAITTFDLVRSAESPMLYNYSIKLRAYNLRNIDRDVEGGDFQAAFLKNMGLDGASDDILTDLAGGVGGAVSAISGLF